MLSRDKRAMLDTTVRFLQPHIIMVFGSACLIAQSKIQICLMLIWPRKGAVRVAWQGVNSMIKPLLVVSPSASIPLVDALVGCRKQLGLGSRSETITKWSQVSEQVEAMLEDAAQHHPLSHGPRAVLDRWTQPREATIPFDSDEAADIRLEYLKHCGMQCSHRALLWGAQLQQTLDAEGESGQKGNWRGCEHFARH